MKCPIIAAFLFTISFSAFFYLLDCLTLTGFLKQYRIKNIWSPPGIEPRTACLERLCIEQAVLGLISGGDQIFLILYFFKKPVKVREYI